MKQDEFKKNVFDTIFNTIKAKDETTAIHCQNVANLSKQIAEKLGISKRKVSDIYYMGLIHDIGKIGMPDSVLKGTKAVLSEEEIRIIKNHVTCGAEIVENSSLIKDLFIGPKYHQEFYDGTGYNEGLSGEDIPLQARIIAVADSVDAMLANRPYRGAMNKEAVLEELKAKSGSQFDPKIVQIAIDLLKNNEAY